MRTEYQMLYILIWIHLFVWVPYILNMIQRMGLWQAIGYETVERPLADWAMRMKMAHYNMVENHVIFFAIVFFYHITDAFDSGSAIAAQVYVAARIAHLIAYTFAIPLGARTMSYAVSMAAKIYLAWGLASIIM